MTSMESAACRHKTSMSLESTILYTRMIGRSVQGYTLSSHLFTHLLHRTTAMHQLHSTTSKSWLVS